MVSLAKILNGSKNGRCVPHRESTTRRIFFGLRNAVVAIFFLHPVRVSVLDVEAEGSPDVFMCVSLIVVMIWRLFDFSCPFSKSTVSPIVTYCQSANRPDVALVGLSISPITGKMTIKFARSMLVDELIYVVIQGQN